MRLIRDSRSTGLARRAAWRGTSRAIAAAAISASGTSTHQSARQPSHTVSTPPSSGPSRFETPALAPQIPSALPRRSGGKPLTAPARAAGLTRPAPTPWTTRVATSTPMLDASAPRPAPSANTPESDQRQAPRAEPIDELAAREEHERVRGEVGAQHDRRRRARHAQPVRHRRQRDRDQRAVELEQRRRPGTGSEPRPGSARDLTRIGPSGRARRRDTCDAHNSVARATAGSAGPVRLRTSRARASRPLRPCARPSPDRAPARPRAPPGDLRGAAASCSGRGRTRGGPRDAWSARPARRDSESIRPPRSRPIRMCDPSSCCAAVAPRHTRAAGLTTASSAWSQGKHAATCHRSGFWWMRRLPRSL